MTTSDSARRNHLGLAALAWGEFRRAKGRQVIFFVIVTIATLGLIPRDVQALKKPELTILANAIAFALIAIGHLIRSPCLFSARQQQEIQDLRLAILKKDSTIDELLAKSRGRPMEQRHADAKRFLLRFGNPARTALRHLKTHGKLVFVGFPPVLVGKLPPGMRDHELLRIYNVCFVERICDQAGEVRWRREDF